MKQLNLLPDHPAGNEPIRFLCQVARQDIDAMLEAYDSGMTDFTTHNAISLALRRYLVKDLPVYVHPAEEDRRFVEVDGVGFELDEPLCRWLKAAETNAPVYPMEFKVTLPARLLYAAPSLSRHAA